MRFARGHAGKRLDRHVEQKHARHLFVETAEMRGEEEVAMAKPRVDIASIAASDQAMASGPSAASRLEPVRRAAERCHNAPSRGVQVRHMKRVIIDGHGLTDQAALVIETIKSGPRHETHAT